jgi:hypothetical protein
MTDTKPVKRRTIHSRWGDYVLTEEPCDCAREWERAMELIDELRRRAKQPADPERKTA